MCSFYELDSQTLVFSILVFGLSYKLVWLNAFAKFQEC